MKLSAFTMYIVIIGALLFVFSELITESNTYYNLDNPINSSSWAGKYDATDQLAATFQPVSDAFTKIADPNSGFFTKIGLGIVAIPYAIIAFPVAILQTMGIAVTMLTGIWSTLDLPKKMLSIIIVCITLFGLFKLVGFWKGGEV